EWKNYRWGPVLGKEAVPSLVDSTGYFFPSRTRLFANNPKSDEIEEELRAQIERALDTGLRIDYLDYHMGAAVQTEELRSLVEDLAKEYGLGMSGYFGEIYSNITYNAAIGDKTDSLLSHVKNLEPGLNMQVLHVGFNDPEMQALKDLNPFGLKDMSRHRREELRSILSPELPGLLYENGVIPITYKDLITIVGLESMKRPEKDDY
ncbi:MAG: ChbG/HpnK family deacetylase, partial [Calditrichia bacterium]|nr:ChbG/HpnK family deacetylase [Calditrichia bacterium]